MHEMPISKVSACPIYLEDKDRTNGGKNLFHFYFACPCPPEKKISFVVFVTVDFFKKLIS